MMWILLALALALFFLALAIALPARLVGWLAAWAVMFFTDDRS